VIGTEYPWLEASLLYLGAANATTLEYGEVKSEHPLIFTCTPLQFREIGRTNQLEPYEVVVSFSSLDHPSLGRYGDALNAWGDLLSVAKARCITKKGGYLAFLAVPAGNVSDHVVFNVLRSYSPTRYPLLVAIWDQVDGEDHTPEPPKYRNVPHIFQNPIDEEL
jgi:hypothetical protein